MLVGVVRRIDFQVSVEDALQSEIAYCITYRGVGLQGYAAV